MGKAVSLIDGAKNALVRELLRGMPVDATIHPRDEMLLHELKDHDWDFALTSYFQRGLEAASMHSQFLAAFFEGRRDIDVLDFAAGFGRVTRFFVAMHTAPRVCASDIQSDAVEFQRAQFGIDAFVSSSDPSQFKPRKRFQYVVALSFFSHVPPTRFTEWLTALAGAVKPEGIVVFSVHDESLIETRDPSGITFRHTSETDRLDAKEYGTAWVSERYVRDAVGRSFPGRSVIRIPRGLASFQDLYVICNREAPVGEFDQGPFGYASIARLFDDELRLVGWVSHWNPDRRVRSVVVKWHDEILASADSFFSRPDVVEHLGGDERHLRSGWHIRFVIPESLSRMTDVITIKAISDRCFETVLYAGTVAGLLLDSCRAEVKASGRETGRTEFEKELEKMKGGGS